MPITKSLLTVDEVYKSLAVIVFVGLYPNPRLCLYEKKKLDFVGRTGCLIDYLAGAWRCLPYLSLLRGIYHLSTQSLRRNSHILHIINGIFH